MLYQSKTVSSMTRFKSKLLIGNAILFLLFLPLSSVSANSSIANNVASFCSPAATSPPVSSCSSCHSTTNNRGPNDLTAAGVWALSQSTFSNFCPAQVPAPTPAPTPNPTPTPTPPPAPTPGTGTGMGSSGTGSSGMGMGSGKGGSRGSRLGSSSGFDNDDDDDGGKDD